MQISHESHESYFVKNYCDICVDMNLYWKDLLIHLHYLIKRNPE